MKRIALTNGGFATVDSEDHSKLVGFPWRRASNGYIVYNTPRDSVGKQQIVYMHRVVLEASSDQEVDHRGSRSDNRKTKIRVCSCSQNQANARIKGRNTSGLRGVHPSKRPTGWKAAIRVSGKGIHLGYFSDKIDAARAYDCAAKKYFGEFARPNFL